jgi:glycosyltransferase involved in cell wall biosynthesis
VVLSTSAHLNAAVIAARPLLPSDTTLLIREGADIASPELACSRLRLLIYKRLYRRADLVICQSEFMKESLIDQFGLKRSKVRRIYNPVDIQFISSQAESEPNPFTGEGPNLLGVGRFSREKGFDLLVNCMPMVRRVFHMARLTLVGDGPNLDALTDVQRELGLKGCVHFVGIRRNPYSYIRHADLVVLPSRCEALPNVVLEAIALGTPVVTTNCTGALGEICRCSSCIGIATDKTPEAIASAIINMLDSRPGRPIYPEPQFEAQFGIRAVTQQYEHILMRNVHSSKATGSMTRTPASSVSTM